MSQLLKELKENTHFQNDERGNESSIKGAVDATENKSPDTSPLKINKYVE